MNRNIDRDELNIAHVGIIAFLLFAVFGGGYLFFGLCFACCGWAWYLGEKDAKQNDRPPL